MDQLLLSQSPRVSVICFFCRCVNPHHMSSESCIFIDKTSSESNHRHLIVHHFSKTIGDSRDGVDGSIRWSRENVNFAVMIIIHVSFLVYHVCLAASFPSPRQLQLHLRFHIFVLDSILCSLQTEISFVN